LEKFKYNLSPGLNLAIGGAPEGIDAHVLADLARGGQDVLFIARDDIGAATLLESLAFFSPTIERIGYPAWDCLPYDRVSPRGEIVARRIDALMKLLQPSPSSGRIIVATVAGILQRTVPKDYFVGAILHISSGRDVPPEKLTAYLGDNGYVRSDTVREPGEFAVRGGIIDLYPTGEVSPLRLDYFGDELERIRVFDAATQRTTGESAEFLLRPVGEIRLDADSISRFRTSYRNLFDTTGDDDPLYQAVSAGRRHAGMEHWLPLFFDRLETLFDYVTDGAIILGHQVDQAIEARLGLIGEYYAARRTFSGGGSAAGGTLYRAIPPDRLHLDDNQWRQILTDRAVATLSPFAPPEGLVGAFDAGGRLGRDFADVRVRPEANIYDAVCAYARVEIAAGRRFVVAAYTAGSRDRLGHLLAEHGLGGQAAVETWDDLSSIAPGIVALGVLGIDHGFTSCDLTVLAEQDILGDRMVRLAGRRSRPANVLAEASSIEEGDLVVHANHGIGRYDGLVTIAVGGAPHDCLRIRYAGNDKLFLPVENIELLSRFGSEEVGAQLDRLGGAGWQARKARMKQRIREMADELIRIAAARELKPAARMVPAEGLFDEFCARFPFEETEDQLRAITDTLDDLASGRPMDRLICGDVGFGKTEIALRAAFVTAMMGKQVVVVVPTTLLARQHFITFKERFSQYPIRIEQLSRLIASRDASAIRAGLTDGTVDIVIGTHALLAKSIRINDLGLLIVDEEQHFGVSHKEQLKQLKADVHVLTLTATPIPRTLQLALTGVRGMSLIATPPIDRLAVRTFVLPYDPVIVREAILREHFRGGQSFYVCPRIEHIDRVAERLRKLVPEVKLVSAHGRMTPTQLEETMTAFSDGAYDVLLSTSIIESGLDLPSVNTIIIHRADMFGLAQLYQLRGRVGRSKVRAYAYLTLPPGQKLTKTAERRLEVMQTLDALGAGFSLASHDLDIRGAGNLLGEEQSGHIREVGIELYQQMLEEAVAEARGGDGTAFEEEEWSPQISTGMPVLIPESYVADLGVRLELYRRIARLLPEEGVDAFAAEMIDRFGPLPAEVENLLQTVTIKHLCRASGAEKVEAGPKGAVVAFRDNRFANPAGLVSFITDQAGTARLRPDHRMVLSRDWERPADRLAGLRRLMQVLAEIAAAA
jgi:transcription-repair coupling factor (superfamily II helicase)